MGCPYLKYANNQRKEQVSQREKVRAQKINLLNRVVQPNVSYSQALGTSNSILENVNNTQTNNNNFKAHYQQHQQHNTQDSNHTRTQDSLNDAPAWAISLRQELAGTTLSLNNVNTRLQYLEYNT